ncbi:MAG: globin [Planctomycetaceae bacterium]|nr:globin [Planctomycetaceae bacterium]
MNQDYETVIASYYRCEDSGGFFDTFYEVFFEKSPEIRPKFAHTEMKTQKQFLAASMLWALRLTKGCEIAHREVEKIGKSHSRSVHNIHPKLYELWLDALCEAIAIHDSQYTTELEKLWRDAMREGIDLIVSKY